MTFPWRHVHFTGLGGVGMTGLALILRDAGVQVSGSDLVRSKNTALLLRRGCTWYDGHHADHVTASLPDVLVYSSAVPEDDVERQAAEHAGVRTVRRGLFLAEIASHFAQVVSVAGSHGKTTVSAMLTHVLLEIGREPGYLVGGEVIGRRAPAGAGRGDCLVTEVDESDGTQAAMTSTHAIVTNAEDDHCWSVGGEAALQENFRAFAARAGVLVTVESPETRALFADHPDVTFVDPADVPPTLDLAVPGAHNRLNATFVVRLLERLGVSAATSIAALTSFRGVDRRLSVRLDTGDVTLIEDYAHHPTEVRASLDALRRRYAGRRLRVILQPHRYERVLRYALQFAAELSLADEVVVTPPFSAWVDDGDLADPRRIVAAITRVPARFSAAPWDFLSWEIADSTMPGDVIAILGAGTITDLVEPLATRLAARPVAGDNANSARRRGRKTLSLHTLGTGECPPVVTVLRGGPSREAPVSLRSGAAVVEALRSLGVTVHDVTFDEARLPVIPADTQVVFPVLHGGFGEDGQIQALLDAAGMPYVGSAAAPCRTMIDKQLTKDRLAAAGVPVARGYFLTYPDTAIPANLTLPAIVKPNRDGSSEGLTCVRTADAWPEALRAALAVGGQAVAEEMLPGTECTVALIDGVALTVVEIRPPGGLYTHDAKYVYSQGKTEYFCPPVSFSEAEQVELQHIAEAAWKTLGARDLLRVDIRLDAARRPHVLEVNNLPGFTATSLVPKAAAQAGIAFPALCLHLVLNAWYRGPRP